MDSDISDVAAAQPSPGEIAQALEVLRRAGVVIVAPPARDLSVGSVANSLEFGKTWVRGHLDEFDHAWRAPGGEIRIPVADVEAMRKRYRLKRAVGRNGGKA